MGSRLPRGLLGATGGVLGTIALLPIARGLAARLFPPPRLPGAAIKAGDIKEATYLEAAVLLVALPVAALFFGHILPRLLESRADREWPFSEWPGAGFGLSLALWRSGVSARSSILCGLLLAALVAVGTPLLPACERLRGLLAPGNRKALSRIFLAGALWGLACRSALFDAKLPLADFPAGALLPGLLFALLAWLLSGARLEDAA